MCAADRPHPSHAQGAALYVGSNANAHIENTTIEHNNAVRLVPPLPCALSTWHCDSRARLQTCSGGGIFVGTNGSVAVVRAAVRLNRALGTTSKVGSIYCGVRQ